ncbi:hypothetical protein [Desulfovibrio inopinatus]|uniref:hypothetical protein n=1 Tax=Desulfovibrio inopinatus TaxID=102109 RepID=UPI0004227358|nr:hypothetical protein [Desulfovibrio inopinatus]
MLRVLLGGFLLSLFLNLCPYVAYTDQAQEPFPLASDAFSTTLFKLQDITNVKTVTFQNRNYPNDKKQKQFNFTIWNTNHKLQSFNRDISRYTGFKPSQLNQKTQISTNLCHDSSCVPSTIQAEGNAIGFFINPKDRSGNLINASSEYIFPPNYRLFKNFDVFEFSYELQVPYATGIAYTGVCLDLKDNRNRLPLWYCINVFDSRKNEIKKQGDWVQARDIGTGTPIIHGAIGRMGKYSSKTKKSYGPQDKTWRGFKSFGFSISRQQLAQAVRDTKSVLRRYNPNSKFNKLSENPSDYSITSINFQGEAVGNSSLGMSARNHKATLYKSRSRKPFGKKVRW